VQNEPDIEAGIRYAKPETLRDAGRVVLEQFDHFGLEGALVLPPLSIASVVVLNSVVA